ncbi:MAG: hypothetical protein HY392_04670 [Candidatus Diapherotrites archaeon]|nr:hypothetical protein [Candidatus Diapherotrites archaeon]
MGKPGKRPKPTMVQVMAEKERRVAENMQKRMAKLKGLVDGLEPPQALFLLQNPKHLSPFVGANNVKPEHLQVLKSMLQKRSMQ